MIIPPTPHPSGMEDQMDNQPRPEAAVDPEAIDAAVLADKLSDPLRQGDADRATADEAMLRAMLREAS